MNLTRNYLLPMFFLMLSFYAFCQEENKVRRKEIKLEERESSADAPTALQSKKVKQREESLGAEWAVKLDPVQAVYGNFPLFIEYAPTRWFSLELGAGLTTKNYMNEILGNKTRVQLGVKPKLPVGYSLSGMARLYYQGNAFDDGGYFGVSYQFLKYRREYEVDNIVLERENDRNYILGFWLGYLFGLDDEERFILDMYAGWVRFREKGSMITEAESGSTNAYNISQFAGAYRISPRLGFKLMYIL